LVAATGAAVGAVMVGPAAGPLEQPPSANNANISPTASARTGALLLILITIVRIISFMMLDPYSARETFCTLPMVQVMFPPFCLGRSLAASDRASQNIRTIGASTDLERVRDASGTRGGSPQTHGTSNLTIPMAGPSRVRARPLGAGALCATSLQRCASRLGRDAQVLECDLLVAPQKQD
jgi:hypothetical protein